MCRHCVSSPRPQRGTLCADDGAYVINLAPGGCAKCGGRALVPTKHHIEEAEEEELDEAADTATTLLTGGVTGGVDDTAGTESVGAGGGHGGDPRLRLPETVTVEVETTTFVHACASCGHEVAEHYHRFAVTLRLQRTMMDCVLCGRGLSETPVDPDAYHATADDARRGDAAAAGGASDDAGAGVSGGVDGPVVGPAGGEAVAGAGAGAGAGTPGDSASAGGDSSPSDSGSGLAASAAAGRGPGRGGAGETKAGDNADAFGAAASGVTPVAADLAELAASSGPVDGTRAQARNEALSAGLESMLGGRRGGAVKAGGGGDGEGSHDDEEAWSD